MYIPPHFKLTNTDRQREFLRKNNFGMLLVPNHEKIEIVHLPFLFLFEDDSMAIQCHVAKENPINQWIDENGSHVKVVIQGAHGYVSSSWYSHENVSTWNYTAAHFDGVTSKLNKSELLNHLEKITDLNEKAVGGTKTFNTLNQKMVQGYLQHIQGYQIHIKSGEFTFKLSQNRNAKDLDSIITHLINHNPHLAQVMETEKEYFK